MSQLSELDFQRLQETLLELKTRNYSLEDQARKQRNALGESQAKATVLQQELSKAQRTIEKSKKLAEVQKIVNENENLQRKLVAQEEDFRLQNQTLLKELSLLVTANEQLEQQIQNPVVGEISSENKPSHEVECDCDNKVSSLQKDLELQQQKCFQLETELSKLKQNEIEKLTDEFSLDLEESDFSLKNLKNKESDYENLKIELEGARSEKTLKEKHNEELRCQLSKKTSEIETLTAQKVALEECLKSKDSELEKLNETLKNSSAKLVKSENQIKECELKIEQKENQIAQEVNKHKLLVQNLNDQIANLKGYCESFSQEKFESLQGQNVSLHSQLEESRIEKEKLSLKCEQLNINIQKTELELNSKRSDLEELHSETENMKSKLSESTSVGDKRKALIDEMAIEIQKKSEEIQQISLSSKSSLEEMERSKNLLIEELKDRVKSLSEENKAIERWQQNYEELEKNLKGLEIEKQKSESQIKDLRLSLEQSEKKAEEKVEELERKLQSEMEKWKADELALKNEYEMKIELVNVQKCEFEDAVQNMKQELKDGVEERKISEKKGQALLKDLKRQLQQERSKNEKLQEKMKECFETTSNASEPPMRGDVDCDRTSVSSWSLMSGQNDRDTATSTPSKLSPSPFHSSNGLINDQFGEEVNRSQTEVQFENDALLSRVGKLQEEKWVLEEKVAMLEQSGAEMAEDLFTKTKLIQQYCMDNKKGTPSKQPATPSTDKVRSFVDKLDKLVNQDGQKETHKQEVSNMQKMLEETLLKNLHLQQDLDNMSKEIERLSKH